MHNKELTRKPPKFYSKSVVTFGTELITPTVGPITREEVRNAPTAESLGQIGTGIGYQIVEFTNVIG